MWDKSKREDGTFSRQDFRFDKKGAVYFCPRGKILETTGYVHGGTTLLHRASKYDCTPCPLKPTGAIIEPSEAVLFILSRPHSITSHDAIVLRRLTPRRGGAGYGCVYQPA